MPTSCTWKVPFKGKFGPYTQDEARRIVPAFSVQSQQRDTAVSQPPSCFATRKRPQIEPTTFRRYKLRYSVLCTSNVASVITTFNLQLSSLYKVIEPWKVLVAMALVRHFTFYARFYDFLYTRSVTSVCLCAEKVNEDLFMDKQRLHCVVSGEIGKELFCCHEIRITVKSAYDKQT